MSFRQERNFVKSLMVISIIVIINNGAIPKPCFFYWEEHIILTIICYNKWNVHVLVQMIF